MLRRGGPVCSVCSLARCRLFHVAFDHVVGDASIAVAVALLTTACGRIAFDDCATQEFFADADGDGFGDRATPVRDCVQPPATVTNADDCDDSERYAFPGSREVCDGIDNDCSPSTVEQCASACAPTRRPAPDDQHVYLLCGTARTWTNARQACIDEGFTLAIIDDAAEDTWLFDTMRSLYGATDTFIGGSDATVEATWSWEDGTQFWQGGPTGAPVAGRYANWAINEPNNGGAAPPENCTLQLAAGDWNDSECLLTSRRFACERM